MIDAHCRRGGKAIVLNPTDRGEIIVVQHGRRECRTMDPLLPRRSTARRG